jgi:beta-lactamase class A
LRGKWNLGVFVLVAASLNSAGRGLQELVAESDGRVGICALDLAAAEPLCVNGAETFPLQSVMKLVVAGTVLDAIDHKRMELSDDIVVRPGEASPGPQDFANLVRNRGEITVTVENLMRRALVDSDSTSADVLVAHLGGIAAVQKFLMRNHIEGLRIDRDERHLQAESVGLVWQAEYADPEKFEAAVKAVPPEKHSAAADVYLRDPRDTATPRGMVTFLKALASGQLLSTTSTRWLLEVIAETATGPDRLKAGTPQNWRLAHKTGTGRIWKGVRSAVNDVGILTSPDGRKIAVAVFVSASKRSDADQAAMIADVARIVTREPLH